MAISLVRPPCALAGPIAVDRIVASMQGVGVITSLQLVRYTAVDMVYEKGYERALLDADMADDLFMRGSLNKLIDRMLILKDARLLSIRPPGREALEGMVRQFGKRFGSGAEYDGFMKRYAVTPAYLYKFMSDELVVRQYVYDEIKILVKISDRDVASYYANNRQEFKGQGRAVAYQRIRDMLEEKKYDEELRAWIKTLSLHREIIIMY